MVVDVSDRPGLHCSGSSSQVPAGLGERIRRLRVSRSLGQEQLAARAGLEEVQLAGVEAGGTTPSLEVLAQVAEALHVALAELFTDVRPGPAAVVQRGDEIPAVDTDGMSVQVLTPRAVAPGLYAARYRIPPSSPGVRPARHDGHDWLYVLVGRLHIEFEQDSATLGAGDSVSFRSRVPHRLSAAGSRSAEFLAVGATLLEAPGGARLHHC
jgi:transcriptional regulator with XRE-family HTH domain